MTRRQEIENIIIGTLLNTFDTDWFGDCSYCITEDMFIDSRNAKIYSSICKYRQRDSGEINPFVLYEFDKSLKPVLVYMLDLSTNYSFFIKKVDYNEKIWISKQVHENSFKYTYIQFSDYVSKFIEYVISEKDKRNGIFFEK